MSESSVAKFGSLVRHQLRRMMRSKLAMLALAVGVVPALMVLMFDVTDESEPSQAETEVLHTASSDQARTARRVDPGTGVMTPK